VIGPGQRWAGPAQQPAHELCARVTQPTCGVVSFHVGAYHFYSRRQAIPARWRSSSFKQVRSAAAARYDARARALSSHRSVSQPHATRTPVSNGTCQPGIKSVSSSASGGGHAHRRFLWLRNRTCGTACRQIPVTRARVTQFLLDPDRSECRPLRLISVHTILPRGLHPFYPATMKSLLLLLALGERGRAF
jgi:hypothetical protein